MAGSVENVYADALFQLAEEDGSLDTVMSELELVASVLKENPEFVKLMDVPTVSADEKKQMISAAFESRVSQLVFSFLNVINDHGRIRYFSDIFENIKEMYNDKNNILEVTVITTVTLSDSLREKLVEKLSALSGKKIVLVEKTDKNIMGGIVLNYKNTRLDASVKMRLENMRRSINSIIA